MSAPSSSLPGAVLLLGPTGSGKSPLGECLEKLGLGGCRCQHFDFGQHLRHAAASAGRHPSLTSADLATVRGVLSRGALLEDSDFHIARLILAAFIQRHTTRVSSSIVLNGLPRHVGQARALAAVVRVELVVYLDCPVVVVSERLRSNAGGDRLGRSDDFAALVARKLQIFRERTAPLVAHYRAAGARVETIQVTVDTEPEAIRSELERRLCHEADLH